MRAKLFFIITFFYISSLLSQSGSEVHIEIPAIFSDNMVLQRDTEVVFWGRGNPHSEVKIEAEWKERGVTKADEDGNWKVSIKTPAAGGPYKITLTAADSIITFKNVLIGEVWLGSGQSNMEMPLAGWPPGDPILNSENEIKAARHSGIRFFSVARSISPEEEFNCTGRWEVCSPSTASAFSATAYFFGKRLYEALNVPIGLIHSSWGGTPVESWIGKNPIVQFDDYKEITANIDKGKKEFELYMNWLRSHKSIEAGRVDDPWTNLDFNDSQCSQVSFDDSNWKIMDLPTLWENSELGNFDGVVWFRKEIEIPGEWIGKELTLELGPIDDMDRTYVNGVFVGGYEKDGFWQTVRVYTIPHELTRDSRIVIAVRVIDTRGGGGIFGSQEQLKLYPAESENSIFLSGEWKYLPVAEYRETKFYLFDIQGKDFVQRPKMTFELSSQTPTVLFNAMIHPLVPYTIRGVIWYQGESNTGNPTMYKALFTSLINHWREIWGRGNFPFYYVQIAPWNYGEETESQKLREAQFKAMSLPNTGMAVTLDIGDVNTIHPANKKDVGERLALWALAKDYERDVVPSGPLYKSMEIIENKIILSFDYAEGGLELKPVHNRLNFQISAEDRIFKEAEVAVQGDKLVLSHPEIDKPVAVRYAWGNTAEATLFNTTGLPASTFRTDEW